MRTWRYSYHQFILKTNYVERGKNVISFNFLKKSQPSWIGFNIVKYDTYDIRIVMLREKIFPAWLVCQHYLRVEVDCKYALSSAATQWIEIRLPTWHHTTETLATKFVWGVKRQLCQVATVLSGTRLIRKENFCGWTHWNWRSVELSPTFEGTCEKFRLVQVAHTHLNTISATKWGAWVQVFKCHRVLPKPILSMLFYLTLLIPMGCTHLAAFLHAVCRWQVTEWHLWHLMNCHRNCHRSVTRNFGGI